MKVLIERTGLSKSVLIDTWWNVNKALSCLPTDIRSVLIDTWWNVNYIQ